MALNVQTANKEHCWDQPLIQCWHLDARKLLVCVCCVLGKQPKSLVINNSYFKKIETKKKLNFVLKQDIWTSWSQSWIALCAVLCFLPFSKLLHKVTKPFLNENLNFCRNLKFKFYSPPFPFFVTGRASEITG